MKSVVNNTHTIHPCQHNFVSRSRSSVPCFLSPKNRKHINKLLKKYSVHIILCACVHMHKICGSKPDFSTNKYTKPHFPSKRISQIRRLLAGSIIDNQLKRLQFPSNRIWNLQFEISSPIINWKALRRPPFVIRHSLFDIRYSPFLGHPSSVLCPPSFSGALYN